MFMFFRNSKELHNIVVPTHKDVNAILFVRKTSTKTRNCL